MKETKNYLLKKPDYYDIVEINDFNSNADKIDFEIKRVNDTLTKNVSILTSQLDSKAKEIDLLVERERINNLTKLNEGNTTGDSELTDIRVGIDGKVYANAGDAVREQFRTTQRNMEQVTHKTLEYPIVWIKNEYITGEGEAQSYSGWERTDFISISVGEKMLLIESDRIITNYCCFYNSAEEKISTFSVIVGENRVFIPQDAVSFRLSKPISNTLRVRNQLFDGFYNKCAVLNIRSRIKIVCADDNSAFTITIPKDTGLSLYHHSNNVYFKEEYVFEFTKPGAYKGALSWNILVDVSTMTLNAVPYYSNYILKPEEYMLFTLFIKNDQIVASLPDSYYKENVRVEDVIEIKTNIEKIAHKTLEYPITWIKNEYIERDGTAQSYSGWERTDFISISVGEKMLLIESDRIITNYCCFYNSAEEKISTFSVIVGENRVFIPQDAVSFRLSKPISNTLRVRNQLFDGFYNKCAVLNIRSRIKIVCADDNSAFTITIPKDTGLSLYHHSNNVYFKEEYVFEFTKPGAYKGALSWNILVDVSTMTLNAVPYYSNYILKPEEYMLFTLFIKNDQIVASLPDSYYKENVRVEDVKVLKENVSTLKENVSTLKENVDNLKNNGIVNGSESGILYYNNDNNVGYLIKQSIRAYNKWPSYTFETKVLSLAVLTDIHGDKQNLERYMEFTKKYSNFITDKLCLGDMVTSKFTSDFTYWLNISGTEKILSVIGNHDTWKDNANYPIEDKTLVYNKYIAPNVSNWGVVQPANAETKGLNYYYKDYVNSSIRLIVLDDNYYDDLQHNWFVATLEEARTKNYHVVVCEHQQPTKVFKSIGSNFETLDYDYVNLTTGYRHQDRLSAVNTFIGNGGVFITWLSGDSHYDKFGVHEGSNGKQLSLVFENAQCSDYWNDSQRVRGQKSQDSFNFVSIDTYSKIIKVIRIGNNTDRYLRPKNTICYNYATHTIISQS